MYKIRDNFKMNERTALLITHFINKYISIQYIPTKVQKTKEAYFIALTRISRLKHCCLKSSTKSEKYSDTGGVVTNA